MLLARLLHKTHRNCTIIARSSTTTVDLYASIWPQTTRINTRGEYSSLATAFAQQRSTCYGRDGTSRSINQENNIEALEIFKKIQFALGAPNRYESYIHSVTHITSGPPVVKFMKMRQFAFVQKYARNVHRLAPLFPKRPVKWICRNLNTSRTVFFLSLRGQQKIIHWDLNQSIYRRDDSLLDRAVSFRVKGKPVFWTED